MKAVSIDTEDAKGYKYAAAIDARIRSTVAQQQYSQVQIAKCYRMKYALELVYKYKDTHINFRNRFTAAIKLEDPIVVDRKSLRNLEKDWSADPNLTVEKKKSKQGIIYQVTVK